MMNNTPRAFVGSVVLVLAGPVGAETAAAVRAEVGRVDGVGRCEVDTSAGTVAITAQRPVDRADLVAVLRRLGCRVLS